MSYVSIISVQSTYTSSFYSPQIGNRFALTAAHCLYDDDNEEVLPDTSFSIMLGVHDRRKAKEQTRFHMIMICISLLYTRRQIRVNKILVHENFTGATNDIALLRLGLNIAFRCDPLPQILITTNLQRR